jgi:N utilization substance protein B
MLSSKRKSRELAMQVLFLWDVHGQQDLETARQVLLDSMTDPLTQQRAIDMAQSAWASRDQTDEWVQRLAPQWPPRRQPGVDRAILRLSLWEMTGSDTPPRVVLDEAIELAKEFSTEQSPAFVNGVLDAAFRSHQTLTADQKLEVSAQKSEEHDPAATVALESVTSSDAAPTVSEPDH